MARFLAERSGAGVVTIVGGGDSVAAVEQLGLADQMSHVRTGGARRSSSWRARRFPALALLDVDEPAIELPTRQPAKKKPATARRR